MFLLNDGLNQIVFLFLFRFFSLLGVNSRSAVCPESFSASSHSVLALLKISSPVDLSDSLRLTDAKLNSKHVRARTSISSSCPLEQCLSAK